MSEEAQTQYVTEQQLKDELAIVFQTIREQLDATKQALELRIASGIESSIDRIASTTALQIEALNKRIDTSDTQIRQVDDRTTREIERISTDVDRKLEKMDIKLTRLDEKMDTLDEIRGILSKQSEVWDLMRTDSTTMKEKIRQNSDDISLVVSSQASLKKQMNGDPDAPEMPSVMSMLSDVKAQVSVVSARLGDAKSGLNSLSLSVSSIQESLAHREMAIERWKNRVTNFGSNVASAATNKVGITLSLVVALTLILLFKPEQSPALIELLVKYLGG